jgi:hypothetical protein
MTGFVSAILGALLALLPLAALVVVILAIVGAVRRHPPRLPRHLRRKRVPGRNPDGEPLSQAMTERLDVIERGYAKTAREPGRRR